MKGKCSNINLSNFTMEEFLKLEKQILKEGEEEEKKHKKN